MTPRDIEKKTSEIERLLSAAARKRRRTHISRGETRSLSGEQVTWEDPFEELARKEEEALAAASVASVQVAQRLLDLEHLPQPLVERIHEEVIQQFVQFKNGWLEWVFDAGPHPLEVMRRMFAYAKMHRADLILNMGFRDIGPLLGETHGAAHARCRVLFGDVPAGWKKPASSIDAMREGQMGNCNRLGGKKLGKVKVKPSENN